MPTVPSHRPIFVAGVFQPSEKDYNAALGQEQLTLSSYFGPHDMDMFITDVHDRAQNDELYLRMPIGHFAATGGHVLTLFRTKDNKLGMVGVIVPRGADAREIEQLWNTMQENHRAGKPYYGLSAVTGTAAEWNPALNAKVARTRIIEEIALVDNPAHAYWDSYVSIASRDLSEFITAFDAYARENVAFMAENDEKSLDLYRRRLQRFQTKYRQAGRPGRAAGELDTPVVYSMYGEGSARDEHAIDAASAFSALLLAASPLQPDPSQVSGYAAAIQNRLATVLGDQNKTVNDSSTLAPPSAVDALARSLTSQFSFPNQPDMAQRATDLLQALAQALQAPSASPTLQQPQQPQAPAAQPAQAGMFAQNVPGAYFAQPMSQLSSFLGQQQQQQQQQQQPPQAAPAPVPANAGQPTADSDVSRLMQALTQAVQQQQQQQQPQQPAQAQAQTQAQQQQPSQARPATASPDQIAQQLLQALQSATQAQSQPQQQQSLPQPAQSQPSATNATMQEARTAKTLTDILSQLKSIVNGNAAASGASDAMEGISDADSPSRGAKRPAPSDTPMYHPATKPTTQSPASQQPVAHAAAAAPASPAQAPVPAPAAAAAPAQPTAPGNQLNAGLLQRFYQFMASEAPGTYPASTIPASLEMHSPVGNPGMVPPPAVQEVLAGASSAEPGVMQSGPVTEQKARAAASALPAELKNAAAATAASTGTAAATAPAANTSTAPTAAAAATSPAAPADINAILSVLTDLVGKYQQSAAQPASHQQPATAPPATAAAAAAPVGATTAPAQPELPAASSPASFMAASSKGGARVGSTHVPDSFLTPPLMTPDQIVAHLRHAHHVSIVPPLVDDGLFRAASSAGGALANRTQQEQLQLRGASAEEQVRALHEANYTAGVVDLAAMLYNINERTLKMTGEVKTVAQMGQNLNTISPSIGGKTGEGYSGRERLFSGRVMLEPVSAEQTTVAHRIAMAGDPCQEFHDQMNANRVLYERQQERMRTGRPY